MRFSAPIYRLKRQAKRLSQNNNIPLNAALDSVARSEGYRRWSHLAAQAKLRSPAADILSTLAQGEMLLVAARPGHGKTILALEIAIAAAAPHRPAYIFSLESNRDEIIEQIKSLAPGDTPIEQRMVIDTSDGICAAHIAETLKGTPPGSVVVIDYLQILDQRRDHPELRQQVKSLAGIAAKTRVIMILISQIDRQFDLSGKVLPGHADIRLPNPVDLSLFGKHCFLHDGRIQFQQAAVG